MSQLMSRHGIDVTNQWAGWVAATATDYARPLKTPTP